MRQRKFSLTTFAASLAGLTAVIFILSTCVPAMASEVDILVRKLVEKGILNKDEGDKILQETKQEAAKEKEQAVKEVKAQVAKDVKEGKYGVVPAWVSNTKLTGDFRLRYAWDDRDGSDQRNRFRFRARLALETKIAETLKFTFGIASGPTDPRSTNQTMSDVFSHKQLNIDLAYVEWKPYDWVNALGGKMKNPIYTVDQLIWDNDIRPEGVAAQFNRKFNNDLTGFLNAAVFILGENATSNNNPYMFVIQPGIEWKPTECTKLKYALGWTDIPNIEGKPQLAYSAKTNTYEKNKAGATVYKYGYNLLTMTGELGFKGPLNHMVNYAALFGEYVRNTSVSGNNSGFMTGFYFGDEKVTDKCQWQFKYSFRRLEADAVLDVLPDSDFYGGATGAYGHKATFQFGLMKNVWYEMNYYRTELIKSPEKPENVLWNDINFKF